MNRGFEVSVKMRTEETIVKTTVISYLNVIQ